MFQRELCKHPLVQTVDYSSHTYLETHHWLKAAVLLNDNPNDFAGRKIYDGYGSKTNARKYLIDTIKGNCPDFIVPNDDRSLVFDSWEALCEKFAQPVFFEKSPQFIAHWSSLELILEWKKNTTFDVKIIGLIRNPMATMYSAYELFYTDPKKRQIGWMNIQRNLLKISERLSASEFKLVKYEDIVSSPVEQFGEICDFIGLTRNKEVGSMTHRESLRKWQTDPYYSFRLSEDVTDLAIKLGYSEQDLFNPIKAPVPVFIKIQRHIKGFLKLSVSRLRDRIIRPLKLKNK